jgi:hypothetical protein
MSKTTNNARTQHAVNVGAASIAMFLIVMAVLVWRLELGRDPVIGTPVAQASQQQVIKRKVVIHRKVIKLIRDLPALPPKSVSSGGASSSGSGSSSYSAPSSSQSYSAPAPVQSAPAQSAPAPAPSTSAS